MLLVSIFVKLLARFYRANSSSLIIQQEYLIPMKTTNVALHKKTQTAARTNTKPTNHSVTKDSTPLIARDDMRTSTQQRHRFIMEEQNHAKTAEMKRQFFFCRTGSTFEHSEATSGQGAYLPFVLIFATLGKALVIEENAMFLFS